MNALRKKIVECARTYVGVPFQHQARLKPVAVDCVGLIVGVAKELGLCDADYTRYPRRPNGMLVEHVRNAGYREVKLSEAQPGDVICFWILPSGKQPGHVGIKTDYGIIHTDAWVKRVVEVTFSGDWLERACLAFAYPGVS